MYISPVDILGITVDELEHLGVEGIEHIERKLRQQRLEREEDTFDPKQFDALFDQLRDAEKRKCILFVEMHPRLKRFLMTGDDDGPKTFSLRLDALDMALGIQKFLAPYFERYFMPLVKRDCQRRKYKTIVWALRSKGLFTTDLLDTCYEFIIAEMRVLVERIKLAKSGELIENCPEITKKSLVRLMNTVPSKDMQEVKMAYVSAMVDYYNQKQERHHEREDLIFAFQNFKGLQLDDAKLAEHLKELSKRVNRGGYQKVSATPSIWQLSSGQKFSIALGAVLMLMVFSGPMAGYLLTTSESALPFGEDYSLVSIAEADNEVSESLLTDSLEDHVAIGHYSESHLNLFYANLISNAPDNDTAGRHVVIENGENPYPYFFSDRNDSDISGYPVPIVNNSNNDVIVFATKTALNKTQCTFIAAGSVSHLFLHDGAENLSFYKGNLFFRIAYPNPTKYTHCASTAELLFQQNYIPNGYFKKVSPSNKGLINRIYDISSLGTDPMISVTNSDIVFSEIEFAIY